MHWYKNFGQSNNQAHTFMCVIVPPVLTLLPALVHMSSRCNMTHTLWFSDILVWEDSCKISQVVVAFVQLFLYIVLAEILGKHLISTFIYLGFEYGPILSTETIPIFPFLQLYCVFRHQREVLLCLNFFFMNVPIETACADHCAMWSVRLPLNRFFFAALKM